MYVRKKGVVITPNDTEETIIRKMKASKGLEPDVIIKRTTGTVVSGVRPPDCGRGSSNSH